MKTYPFKIKRHLSQGKYYQFWQIKINKEQVYYYQPEIYSLILTDCQLANQINAAKKIFDGQDRQPCGWIKAQQWEVIKSSKLSNIDISQPIFYNPKVSPIWRDTEENCLDNLIVAKIITLKNRPYIQQLGNSKFSQLILF
jgi:hypothetical protein